MSGTASAKYSGCATIPDKSGVIGGRKADHIRVGANDTDAL